MSEEPEFCPDALLRKVFRITMACCALLIAAFVIVPML
jgi:hypothetical protein